jgi:hypothetical protein
MSSMRLFPGWWLRWVNQPKTDRATIGIAWHVGRVVDGAEDYAPPSPRGSGGRAPEVPAEISFEIPIRSSDTKRRIQTL